MISVDWFTPGYKAGGIITAMANLVHVLKEEYAIFILTSDRDLTDSKPYPGCTPDVWQQSDGYQIYYARRRKMTWHRWMDVFRTVQPHHFIINGIFSFRYSILPLGAYLRSGYKGQVLLLPHGMLKLSALSFKPFRKLLLLRMYRHLRVSRKVLFLTSSPEEAADVQSVFGNKARSKTLAHFPFVPIERKNNLPKSPGAVSFLFVGRIHPIKNLIFLLRALLQVKGNLQLTIIGNIEDFDYWRECLPIISQLRERISISVIEAVPQSKLREMFATHHFLALPTKGENFGYAILESLSAGTPVIISNQTPWQGLVEKKVGWDVDVDTPNAYINALAESVDMDQEKYSLWSESAYEYSKFAIDLPELVKQYAQVFNSRNLANQQKSHVHPRP